MILLVSRCDDKNLEHTKLSCTLDSNQFAQLIPVNIVYSRHVLYLYIRKDEHLFDIFCIGGLRRTIEFLNLYCILECLNTYN